MPQWLSNDNIKVIAISLAVSIVLGLISFFVFGTLYQDSIDTSVKYIEAYRPSTYADAQRGANTNIGKAWLVGRVKVLDPVKTKYVKGEFLAFDEVYETYTMHTRMVSYTVNGKTQYRTETYWSWDVDYINSKVAEEFVCMGVKGHAEQLTSVNGNKSIVSLGQDRRVVVTTKPSVFNASLFSVLKNGENSKAEYYSDKPEKIIKNTESIANTFQGIQWWSLVICILIGLGFCAYYISENY